MLRLFDTATGERSDPLGPRDPGEVVHVRVRAHRLRRPPPRPRPVHAGLRRAPPLPALRGLDVDYVSNITDIDDKIIERAAERGAGPSELTADVRGGWWEAMDALGVLRPTLTPHATAYVDEMVALVAELVDRGVAYETADGVYLEVADVAGYGLLAGQPLDSLRAGAAGRGRRGEALAPRLRAVEEGQAGRAHLAVAVGARADRAGTPSAW